MQIYLYSELDWIGLDKVYVKVSSMLIGNKYLCIFTVK